jgi:hypothetical protein
MPAPVILKVEFTPGGTTAKPAGGTRRVDSGGTAITEVTSWLDPNTALVSYPVDVWFSGSRLFVANLNFGPRTIAKITLDPNDRFPDKNASDNVWPRAAASRTPGAN